MIKDFEVIVPGLIHYTPTVARHTQKHSLEMLALLLIVGSAARIEASPIDVYVLELSVRVRIRQIEAQALNRLRQHLVRTRVLRQPVLEAQTWPEKRLLGVLPCFDPKSFFYQILTPH